MTEDNPWGPPDTSKEGAAIKEFLMEKVLPEKVGDEAKYGIDVSFPRTRDLDRIRSRIFDLTNVAITPSAEGNNFHCFVGFTEIHFVGQAAADIRKILEQSNTEN